MTKLICDFSSFNTQIANIKSKIGDFNILLNNLITLENTGNNMWNSDAQRTYYNKFMERKSDLEQLSRDYKELIDLLDDINSTYQNIESNF